MAKAMSCRTNVAQEPGFPDGAIIFFDRNLRHTLIAGVGLEAVGLSRELMKGKPIWEIFPAEICRQLAPHYRRVLAGQASTVELSCAGRIYQVRILPIQDEHGEIQSGMAVTQDITESKVAEAELQRSQQQYEQLVNTIDSIVWEGDAQTFAFSFVSQQAERLLGYPCQRWINEPTFWHDHIHPDDREWAPIYCALATAERRSHEFEYRMIAADGRTVWLRDIVTVVVENGVPTQLRGVMIDITERVQAEAALREREAQYRSIFESSIDGLIINQLDGQLVDFNPAAACMHGYTEEEFHRLQPMHFIHPSSLLLFQEYLETVKTGGKFRGRAVAVRKNGSQFHIEIVGTQFTYRGQPHALAVVRDVTDEVQAYQLLEQRVEERTHVLYEQARALASLEERQKLARELHDSVSQALYGIGLGAQTARAMLDNRELDQLAEPVDYILSLTDAALIEMRALIFELRPESLEAEGLAVALSKQAAVMRARHRLDVVTVLCDEPQASLAVKEALYRIAQEGLHNVVKHACASRVELRLDVTNGQLILEIVDNGRGFDTGGSFPGHLGLHSMRERVEQVKGAFVLHSIPGQGTYLHFEVPLHQVGE